MKNFKIIILLGFIALTGCKSEKKSETAEPEKELTIVEKIAYANGYDNWKNVEELKFTFNVDRDTSHFERSWVWKPKTNQVTAISATDTLTYNRNDMDSTAYKTNGHFINDKYWLMAPINILWDKGSTTVEHTTGVEAPMSKTTMQKLSVTYNQQDGYTPGDAYDFYFADDFMVKEWIFRRGNQPDPSMVTTWEDYMEAGGLKFAKMHQNDDGSFKLYFTGVEVNTD